MSQSINLFNIYLNLFEFAKFRKYTIDEKNIDKDEFNEIIDKYNYILVKFNKGSTKIILFNYNDFVVSKFVLDTTKKLLKEKNKNDEYIVITKNIITKALPSEVNNYFYKHFKIIIPNHVLVPKYTILSKEEKDKLLNNQLYLNESELLVILSTDPIVIWYGAKPKDVLKEVYIENCGKFVNYRIVQNKE